MVYELLNKSASLVCVDKMGWTPLDLATRGGQ